MAQVIHTANVQGGRGVLASIKNTGCRQVVAGKLFSSHVEHTATENADQFSVPLKNIGTVRKALSELNGQMAAPTCLKPPTPASRSNRLAVKQLKNQNPQPSEQHQQMDQQVNNGQTIKISKDKSDYPEIEHIPHYEETEDDFSDVWDPSQRPDTYLSAILESRPMHLYPCRHDGYDEKQDNNENLLDCDMDSSLEDFRIPDMTLEDIDLPLEKDDYSAEILLPSLDDVWSVLATHP